MMESAAKPATERITRREAEKAEQAGGSARLRGPIHAAHCTSDSRRAGFFPPCALHRLAIEEIRKSSLRESFVWRQVRFMTPRCAKCEPEGAGARDPSPRICYGMQWITHTLGGTVEKATRREYAVPK